MQTIVAAVGVVIAGLWFYLQVVEWKAHGHNYMPFLVNSLVSLALWSLAGYLVWTNRRALDKRDELALEVQRLQGELEIARRVSLPANTQLPSQPVKEENLQQRTLSLSKEICSWFIELGPKPPGKFNADMTALELQAANYPRDLWVEKLHHEFVLKFEDRVNAIYHEFAARGISNPDLSKGVYTDVSVQNIAKSLGHMAADLNELDSKPNNTLLKRESTPALEDKKGPHLGFAGHNIIQFSCSLNGNYGFTLFFKNAEVKRDTTAHKVSVSLTFRHIDGDTRKAVGMWLISSQTGMIWAKRISIGMGIEPKWLPLFYWPQSTDSCEYRLIDASTLIVNDFGIMINVNDSIPIQLGQWDLTINFVGDNLEEEWSATLTLGKNGLVGISTPIRRS